MERPSPGVDGGSYEETAVPAWADAIDTATSAAPPHLRSLRLLARREPDRIVVRDDAAR